MKRHILLAVTLVLFIGWAVATWYFRDVPEPTPNPTPESHLEKPNLNLPDESLDP